MRQRKLIRPDKLYELYHQTSVLGVPLARAISNLQVEGISRPAVISLLKCLEAACNETVSSSLVPDWLKKDGNIVQEQPKNYKYEGFFPLGKWVKLYENN